MVDARVEIEHLYQDLLRRGFDELEADEMCFEASEKISDSIADAIQDALLQAVEIGSDERVREFLSELGVQEFGGGFKIRTSSGKEDFSQPPLQKLPYLLRNAKQAKDGSLYKVLPLQDSVSSGKPIIDVQAFITETNSNRRASTEQRRANRGRASSYDPAQAAADIFRGVTPGSHVNPKEESMKTGPVRFRVATSKQDPGTQWVQPGKDANFSEALNEINWRLEQEIDSAIISIIREYSES